MEAVPPAPPQGGSPMRILASPPTPLEGWPHLPTIPLQRAGVFEAKRLPGNMPAYLHHVQLCTEVWMPRSKHLHPVMKHPVWRKPAAQQGANSKQRGELRCSKPALWTSPSACEPQTLHTQVTSPPLLVLRASLGWLLHLRYGPHGDWDWRGLMIFPRLVFCHFINS